MPRENRCQEESMPRENRCLERIDAKRIDAKRE